MWQPESFLWRYLRARGVRFGRASFPVVLLRGAGPSCFQADSWKPLMAVLDVLSGDTAGSIAAALHRANTAFCLHRLSAELSSPVSLSFTVNGVDLVLRTPWDPLENRLDLSAFCDARGFLVSPCKDLQTDLARRGVTFDDTLISDREHVDRVLARLEHSSQSGGAKDVTVELTVPAHEDLNGECFKYSAVCCCSTDLIPA